MTSTYRIKGVKFDWYAIYRQLGMLLKKILLFRFRYLFYKTLLRIIREEYESLIFETKIFIGHYVDK